MERNLGATDVSDPETNCSRGAAAQLDLVMLSDGVGEERSRSLLLGS